MVNRIPHSVGGGDEKKRELSNWKKEIVIFWDGEGVHAWEDQEFHVEGDSLWCLLDFQVEMSSGQLDIWAYSSGEKSGLETYISK